MNLYFYQYNSMLKFVLKINGADTYLDIIEKILIKQNYELGFINCNC